MKTYGKMEYRNEFQSQAEATLTIKTTDVMAKVWKGWTFGITAKTVSPTKPLELDATPDSLTGRSIPVFPAT